MQARNEKPSADSENGTPFKREDDGREGAISGRLARKSTGVSPSGFARTDVLAGKGLVNYPGHY